MPIKNRCYWERKIDDAKKDIENEEQKIKFANENIAFKRLSIENYEKALRALEKRNLRLRNKN